MLLVQFCRSAAPHPREVSHLHALRSAPPSALASSVQEHFADVPT